MAIEMLSISPVHHLQQFICAREVWLRFFVRSNFNSAADIYMFLIIITTFISYKSCFNLLDSTLIHTLVINSMLSWVENEFWVESHEDSTMAKYT